MTKQNNDGVIAVHIDALAPVGVESNLTATIVDGLLVLVVDLNKDLGVTESGKSLAIASTHGFVPLSDGLRGSIWIGKKAK